MQKILLINTYYYPNGKGGAEKSTQILAESLAKKGFKVSVITSSGRNYSVKINDVDIFYVNMGNLYWLLNAKSHTIIERILWHIIDSYGLNNTKEFEKILKIINPDIVLTNNLVQFSCKIWKILSRQNILILHILRDHYLMNLSTIFKSNQNFFNKYITGKLLSIRKKKLSCYVNGVVGISNYILKKHLENNYFKNTIVKTVIPNAIQTNGIDIKLKFKNYSKKEPVFGYIGALNSNKGVDLIVNTFKDKVKNKLLLFGSGNKLYIEKLLKIISKYPNILYLGYQQPYNIFKKIDCLIVPSLINEAFGRVIIEAYSYGIPVIGSKRGGIPELIDDKITGFLFEPNEKNSLLTIIKVNSLDKEINLDIKSKAKNKTELYSSERITNQYINIFSVLKSNN